MSNEGYSENQEKSIELHVLYSIPREVLRVNQTVYDLPRLKKLYGEIDHVSGVLPNGITETSSDSEITESVSEEFDDSLYKDFATYIENQQDFVGEVLKSLRIMDSFKIFEKYIIELTRYGTGGSYSSLDGKVWVKIWKNRTKESVVATMVHEIIHIGINHLIEQYFEDKTNDKHHWYKERLVDLIGEKYFPGMRKMQDLDKEIIQEVDEVFERLFPDIESIVKTLATKAQ